MSDDYRLRLVEAIAQAECEERPRCVDCMASAAEAVRDEEIEKLRADLAHTEKIANDVIGERDMAHDILDRFAQLVAPVEVIGEHTSGNNPWRNAMDMVTPAAVVEKLRAQLADANATLTELAPLSLGVRAEKAEAAIAEVRKIHRPFAIYEVCNHLEHDEDTDFVYIVEEGESCKTTPLYTVCHECCAPEDELSQDHDETHDTADCWPCPTRAAVDGEAK